MERSVKFAVASILVFVIVVCSASAFLFLDFKVATSETVVNSEVGTYRSGQLEIKLASELHVFVEGEGGLTEELKSTLTEKLRGRGVEVLMSESLKEKYGRQALLVALLDEEVSYNPLYTASALEVLFFYSSDGNTTYFDAFKSGEQVTVEIGLGNLLMKGTLTLADTTRGVISLKAYHRHLAEEAVENIIQRLPWKWKPEPVSEEESLGIALEFVSNSPTFRFDGMEETLEHVQTFYPEIAECPHCWEFAFTFKCRHSGYGNRTGQMVLEVITPHTAHIVVQEGEVMSATIDCKWDMIKQEMIQSQTPGFREFLVEDNNGDRMVFQVSTSRQEAIEGLNEMSETGEEKWVGGEIERFENEFGFRFKPDTILVAEVTAEGLQASSYKYIQQDFDYW
jgi:hypothetical protein